VLDDPSPDRTAPRKTRVGQNQRASAFDLIELWKSSSRFLRVRPGPRCTGHRGLV